MGSHGAGANLGPPASSPPPLSLRHLPRAVEQGFAKRSNVGSGRRHSELASAKKAMLAESDTRRATDSAVAWAGWVTWRATAASAGTVI
jgi:hypothetical protein